MARSTLRLVSFSMPRLGARGNWSVTAKSCNGSRQSWKYAIRSMIITAALFAGLAGSHPIAPAIAQQGVVESVSTLDAVVESVDQQDRTGWSCDH